jgi:hypothetical protein
MKLYRSPTNEIYAYEQDGSQDHLIPLDYVAVTQEQANLIIAEQTTAEQNKITAMMYLQATDWSVATDVTDTNNSIYLLNQADFIAYRDAIRQYAVYPVAGKIDWAVMPQEQWSNSK